MNKALIDKVNLRLEARDIPTPAQLSGDARAYIAASIMAPFKPLPAVDDVAGWAVSAANFNARLMPLMEPVFNTLPVAIETRRIGECVHARRFGAVHDGHHGDVLHPRVIR